MNQCNPAEGKKASLLLNLESDCAVLPHKKDYSRALHHYTFSFFSYQSFFIFFIPFLTENKTLLNILSLRGKTKSPDLSI